MLAVGAIARVGVRWAHAGSARRAGGGLRPRRGPAAGARRGGAAGDPDGPEGPGMRFVADGVPLRNGRSGRALPAGGAGRARAPGTRARHQVDTGVRARFDRWYARRADRRPEPRLQSDVGFVDLEGSRVDPGVVSTVTLVGSNGGRRTFAGGRRMASGQQGRSRERRARSTAVSYAPSAWSSAARPSCTAHSSASSPPKTPEVQLRLLLFSARFVVRDALLGFPIGSAVRLEYPSGHVQRHGLTQGADLTIGSLPRGDYRVNVDALGISSSRPVALSGDQRIELRVISWLDIVVVLLGLASLALGLLYLRRPTRAGSVAVALLVVVDGRDGRHARSPRRRAARPTVRLLLHLVQRQFLGARQDRLPAPRPLLERRPRCDEAARPLGEARRHRRLHRQLEEHARAESAPRAPRRGGCRRALQAARDLSGARLLPRAAAGRARGPRPRLLPAPLRGAGGIRRLRESRS